MSNPSEIFYQTIADYYELIFPLNEQALDFTRSHLPSEAKVLDIGCATGAFSAALAEYCRQIEAFDLNENMVAIAKKKRKCNLSFRVEDMMHIEENYPAQHFDILSCFGNTLVHLLSEKNILSFLEQAYRVLSNKGVLLLQILNYDKILDTKVKKLPKIENERLCFERHYRFQEKKRLIHFDTVLHLKEEKKKIVNNSLLYAIRPNELKKLMKSVGFSNVRMYSSFSKDVLTNDKLPLVVEAFV